MKQRRSVARIMSDTPQLKSSCPLVRCLTHCIPLLCLLVSRHQERFLTTLSIDIDPHPKRVRQSGCHEFLEASRDRVDVQTRSSNSGAKPSDFGDRRSLTDEREGQISVAPRMPVNLATLTAVPPTPPVQGFPRREAALATSTVAPETHPFQCFAGGEVAPMTSTVEHSKKRSDSVFFIQT